MYRYYKLRLECSLLLLAMLFTSLEGQAQYKQKEYQKYPEEKIFPTQPFDSLAAKKAMASGNVTLTGVAFTKQTSRLGIKPPLSPRILGDHIIVYLFPATPYFEEWYQLKKNKENLKKNKRVYMDNSVAKYALTCETNKRGEFTFPDRKPGKYFLVGNLPWTSYGTYLSNEGMSIDQSDYSTTKYYKERVYSESHNDFLMQEIEIPEGQTIVNIKLK